jgi:aryl-alcohol dehydrogenase-like predicted oxidoreductase
MEKRRIGSLDVSVVGLGCNNFGRRLEEAQTKIVVDAALDAGINFFDTADVYGNTLSEQQLGNVLGTRRNQIVLATKFGMDFDEKRTGGAKPDYIKTSIEGSLTRLKTDRIDLYQLHRPDENTPIADTLGALNDLVQAGKVREIGCSNFSAAQLQEAKAAAKGAKFVSVQNEFSLLHQEPLDEVLPECEREGLAFIPYFPLSSGLLTGKYRKGHALPEGTRITEGSKWLEGDVMDRVEKLIGFAEAHGHTILELAFGWLLAHGAVASVIAGATKREQIAANAGAVGWKLSPAEVAEVKNLVGPQTVGA